MSISTTRYPVGPQISPSDGIAASSAVNSVIYPLNTIQLSLNEDKFNSNSYTTYPGEFFSTLTNDCRLCNVTAKAHKNRLAIEYTYCSLKTWHDTVFRNSLDSTPQPLPQSIFRQLVYTLISNPVVLSPLSHFFLKWKLTSKGSVLGVICSDSSPSRGLS